MTQNYPLPISDEILSRLEHYKKIWNLTDFTPVAKTNMCDVFLTEFSGQPAVIKLLNATGKKFESLAPRVLDWLDGHGTVRIFQYDEEAHLLEFVDGEMLDAVVKRDGDIAATKIICDTLKKIHSLDKAFPEGLHTMERNFRSLFLRCKSPECEALFLRGEKMARHLLDSPFDIRVIHGDLHHQNLLHHSQRGWIAIDPQCLIGERTYDVANTLFNPACLEDEQANPNRIRALAQIFSERLEIPKLRILQYAFAYGCLSSVWMIDDGFDPSLAIRVTEAIESCLHEINQND